MSTSIGMQTMGVRGEEMHLSSIAHTLGLPQLAPTRWMRLRMDARPSSPNASARCDAECDERRDAQRDPFRKC